MSEVSTRVIVAGTSGGVGATTVAALLFDARRSDAPRLFDHSGGELGFRLAEGDDAPHLNPRLGLHDLGPHARGEALELVADQSVVLVIVAPATPAGAAAAESALGEIASRYSSTGLSRTLVAFVGVFGRHRLGKRVEDLRNVYGRHKVVVFPQDGALAAGGRVPLSRLSAETRRAQAQLAGYLREVLAMRAGR